MEVSSQVPQALLNPIADDNPCGQSLKYDQIFDDIQEARREDDETLPQGVWETDLKKADWDEVERLAVSVLESQSKDLQVAAWLTEAWFKKESISGLNRGVQLMSELIRLYWPQLYPSLDDDLEYRLRPFLWLNEKLTQQFLLFPLTHLNQASQKNIYFHEWLTFQKKPSSAFQDQLQKKILETSRSFYESLSSNLIQIRLDIDLLQSLLLEKAPKSEGIFYKLRETIHELSHFCQKALSLFPEDSPTHKEEQREVKAMIDTTPTVSQGVQIQNREQAYALLEQIASFLQQREPHSPTPFLIRRAVSWGHMGLAELINEFSKDPAGLNQLTRLLGLDGSDSSSLPPSQSEQQSNG